MLDVVITVVAFAPHARPYFQLQPDGPMFTAQEFVATRFGSTKIKSHQGVDAGLGYHPFTAPSLYAYLQLLIFLNALACLTDWSEKLEEEFAETTPNTDETRKEQNGADDQNSVPQNPDNNADDELHDECMC
ncbi:unnamed protein product [Gongylonema pulchrum]|uniref:COesterase domain-containing protein n=1 Tax=Gongylonema pulchrum TaxID=637853 RepID=A0A183DGZ2_9BILA|nr:unnamed protein product [Gongylonema pulchrum]